MEEYIIWTIGILFIAVFVTSISTIVAVLVWLGEKIKEKMNDKISN